MKKEGEGAYTQITVRNEYKQFPEKKRLGMKLEPPQSEWYLCTLPRLFACGACPSTIQIESEPKNGAGPLWVISGHADSCVGPLIDKEQTFRAVYRFKALWIVAVLTSSLAPISLNESPLQRNRAASVLKAWSMMVRRPIRLP